jgi:hypothetical protein
MLGAGETSFAIEQGNFAAEVTGDPFAEFQPSEGTDMATPGAYLRPRPLSGAPSRATRLPNTLLPSSMS